MSTQGAVQLVWLKRDLRWRDHAPLAAALRQNKPLLALFIFEPLYQEQVAYSLRHWQAQYHSLRELQAQLSLGQNKLWILYGSSEEIFAALQREHHILGLYSHQESDILASYERDKRLARFFADAGIPWQQFPHNGVVRGLRNRQDWDQRWRVYMQSPCEEPDLAAWQPAQISSAIAQRYALPAALEQSLAQWPAAYGAIGEKAGHARLRHFLSEGWRNYSRHISKPQESRLSCGRFSVYLAWGNLSLRQIYQAALAAYEQYGQPQALRAFISRLHWHSHFVQKFEMEHRMEWSPLNRAIAEDAPMPLHPDGLAAWREGRTGYPLIDACMEALRQSGYLNFRMRAMLVSFVCHHLREDWRAAAAHLGALFLDFIPGIHYPQVQMQAGLTGINTLRIYNPVKQAEEHDPEGKFAATWLPILHKLPPSLRNRPWQISAMEELLYDFALGRDYPRPLIDHESAAADARERLWKKGQLASVKAENARILARHTTANRRIATRTRTVLQNP